uniref:H0302E05.4 protein n=1 Tax=Oryza sativa TaxID=4530 RepID=I7HK29_ORYSA|nr:H0302E05.4 [Oryza sativa]
MTTLLSDLPDDVLLLILDKLDTRDAVRCSLLSRRWSRVPGMLANIELDVDSFAPDPDDDHDDGFTSTLSESARSNHAMVRAVQSILAAHESRHAIRRLGLSFFSRDESVGIVRAVDDAMARGRRIHDLWFTVSSEKPELLCAGRDVARQGARLASYRDKYPRVFAGLTRLHVECVKLGAARVSAVSEMI